MFVVHVDIIVAIWSLEWILHSLPRGKWPFSERNLRMRIKNARLLWTFKKISSNSEMILLTIIYEYKTNCTIKAFLFLLYLYFLWESNCLLLSIHHYKLSSVYNWTDGVKSSRWIAYTHIFDSSSSNGKLKAWTFEPPT